MIYHNLRDRDEGWVARGSECVARGGLETRMPVFGLTIGMAFLVLDAELVGGC